MKKKTTARKTTASKRKVGRPAKATTLITAKRVTRKKIAA